MVQKKIFYAKVFIRGISIWNIDKVARDNVREREKESKT